MENLGKLNRKILLTSSGFSNPKIGQEFINLLDKNLREIKILFITTASRVEEEKFYVKESEKELIDLGIIKENIKWVENLENIETNGHDVMYICGGNTFYLMSEIRRTGFDKKIIDFINSGKVYIGVSAGSVIMGPSILHIKNLDKNDVGLKNLSGFSITDKILLPHYKTGEEKLIEKFEKDNNSKTLRLADGQALEIVDDNSKIIK